MRQGLGATRIEQLRLLDVAKAKPHSFDASSTQALFDLVEEFREEGQPLHINIDPTKSETFQAETAFWGDCDR